MSKMGHNSAVLTDAEAQAVFVEETRIGYDLYLKQKAAAAALTQHHKQSKAKGITVSKMKIVYKALDSEDEAKPGQHLQDHFEALSAFGFVTAKQLDMFETEKDAQVIYDQGFRAGVMRKERKSSFSAGSPDDQEWLRGFDDGTKHQNEQLASAMNKLREDDGAEDLSPDADDEAA